jgi:hypothetical protein
MRGNGQTIMPTVDSAPDDSLGPVLVTVFIAMEGNNADVL